MSLLCLYLLKTISDILVYLLYLLQAHGIDHLVIPTRDYLFAPSFVDISRAVQFIHCGFLHFYLVLGRGVNASMNVFICYLKSSFACVYVLLLYFGTDNATCGKTTYVHCKAGRGRSTTIVLCYLVNYGYFTLKVVASVEALRCLLIDMWSTHVFQVEYKHMTPVAALEYVRSRRPRVLLAPSQWKV